MFLNVLRFVRFRDRRIVSEICREMTRRGLRAYVLIDNMCYVTQATVVVISRLSKRLLEET
jgi:hypothetical protein